MPLRRPFPRPLPPPSSTHTHTIHSSFAAFRILAIIPTPQNHPLPRPLGLSYPKTTPDLRTRSAQSSPPVCTPFAYARATRYICGVYRRSPPVNSSDMSLELEEFDLGGSRGTEGGANWVVERVPAEVLIRFLDGIEMGRRDVAVMSLTKFFDLVVSKIQINSISPLSLNFTERMFFLISPTKVFVISDYLYLYNYLFNNLLQFQWLTL